MSGLFLTLNDIRSNPDFSFYYNDCKEFFDYLQDIQFKTIKIIKQFQSGVISESEFNVVFRWSETYRKSIIAKFYKLQEWFEETPKDVTFLTLTVSGKNRTIKECFDIIIESRNKLMKAVRRIIKHKFDYVWVIEPHPSGGENHGYPHVHMILFESLDLDEQLHLRKLWEKYGAGSFEHGLDFDVREKQEKINNLKNYLIKYLSKSWIDSGSKYAKNNWDPEMYIFNTIAWKHQYRFWGCSRNLSKIMAYVPSEAEKLIKKQCISTQLRDSYFDEPVGQIWRADDRLIIQCEENYNKYYERLSKMQFGRIRSAS